MVVIRNPRGSNRFPDLFRFITQKEDLEFISDTVLRNTEIRFPVLANTQYSFNGLHLAAGPAAGRILLHWVLPAAGVFRWGNHTTAFQNTIATNLNLTMGSTVRAQYFMAGSLLIGATAGEAILQVSQQTSDPATTTYFHGSYLLVTETPD